jgi:Plavaka transposase
MSPASDDGSGASDGSHQTSESTQPASDDESDNSSHRSSKSAQPASGNNSDNNPGPGHSSNSNDGSFPSSPSPSYSSGGARSMSASMGPELDIQLHPLLDGTPCDVHGYDLLPGADPPPQDGYNIEDFSPFSSQAQFEFAQFIFAEEQMSAGKLDKHLNNLAELYPDSPPPFTNHRDMYSTIDSITVGDVPWQTFSVSYNGDIPEDSPAWMTAKYEVCYWDPLLVMEQQLGNKDFDGQIDFSPKRIFQDGKRQYMDLMSGNWAWEQAVRQFSSHILGVLLK